MSNLIVFKNQNFGEVRTIEKNEEVWFILNDVCAILEIANARDTKSRLDKGGMLALPKSSITGKGPQK